MRDGAEPLICQFDTIPKLLRYNARVLTTQLAVCDKKHGLWQSWNWLQMENEVRDFALGLLVLELSAGEKVAILGNNCPKLYWAMAAIQSIGAIPVPIDADMPVGEIAFIFDQSDIVLAVVEDWELANQVSAVGQAIGGLRCVVYDQSHGRCNNDCHSVKRFDEIQDMGRNISSHDDELAVRLDQHVMSGKGTDLAVILYTPNAIGLPKGVMLSFDNLIISAYNHIILNGLDEHKSVMACSSMAWIGDHMLCYVQSYLVGYHVNYPECAATVNRDRLESEVDYDCAPAYVYENIMMEIMHRMENAGLVQGWLFQYFLTVARCWGERLIDGKTIPLFARLQYFLGELIIYRPLKKKFGLSYLRLVYIVGAINEGHVLTFFRSLGINLKRLYGRAEASIYVAMQPDGKVKPETVGSIAPAVKIKISERGEVLYRSPGIFLGYHGDDAATQAIKTDTGWVMSGDAGFIDRDRDLHILGPIDSIGVLSDGTVFAPDYIERKLEAFPFIRQSLVIGEGREMVCALIDVDRDMVRNFMRSSNCQFFFSEKDLTLSDDVYALVENCIDMVNRDLAMEMQMVGAQIRRFMVLQKEFRYENEILSCESLKLQRHLIEDCYTSLINIFYSDDEKKRIYREIPSSGENLGTFEQHLLIRDTTVYPPIYRVMEAAE